MARRRRVTIFVTMSDLSEIDSYEYELLIGIYSDYQKNKRVFAFVYGEGSNCDNSTTVETESTVSTKVTSTSSFTSIESNGNGKEIKSLKIVKL